jgi:hypothetical protein
VVYINEELWVEHLDLAEGQLRHPTLVILAAAADSPEALRQRVGRWLSLGRDVAALVLGLGSAGECDRLSGLISAYGGRTAHRFLLVREQGPGFHDSQIGLVYRRDHPCMDDVVYRLRQVFTGNMTFLSLAQSACEAAIQAAARDRELEALRHVETSASYRLAHRLAKAGAMVAPRGSARRRLMHKTARALQALKAQGLRGFSRRS